MATHPAETGAIGTKLRGGAASRAIADLAERQHGLVARRQLVELGVSQRAIGRRVADRELRRVHRGVYATGHAALSADAWAMAAVLFAGHGAVLSHRSAAALWGMVRSVPARAEVTVPHERRQSRAVRFHYGRIEADEVTVLRGIPITGVSRTIFDLASTVSPQRVAAAMKEAEVLRLTDTLSLQDLLARYPCRAGTGVLRAVMHEPLPRTRSELEIVFLEFLDARGLPRPETNVWLQIGERWIEADCVWRRQQVIAELDSHSAHGTPHAFEADRARGRRLAAHEWDPIRVTWRAIHEEAAALEADLRLLLTS
jgi:predicted transcriptional regulator of viral defense system